MKRDGSVLDALQTNSLVPEDQLIVKNWEKTSATPLPPPRKNPTGPVAKAKPADAKPQPPPGLVLPPNGVLRQGKGGFGQVIDELGVILKPYGNPVFDTDAHPATVIYSGESTMGGHCTITYLMPLGKAVELLLGRAGLTAKLDAVTPGFPPGLSIYNYDRKFRGYDHLTIVTDSADQVVTIMFKSDTKAMCLIAGPEWKVFHLKTSNYINLKNGGGETEVFGKLKGDDPVIVNNHVGGFKETTTWFVPRPLVRMILFNAGEKKKARN